MNMLYKEPNHDKICIVPYGNKKDADQTSHLFSLINIWSVCCVDVVSLVMRKPVLGFQSGPTQTELYNHRRWLNP